MNFLQTSLVFILWLTACSLNVASPVELEPVYAQCFCNQVLPQSEINKHYSIHFSGCGPH